VDYSFQSKSGIHTENQGFFTANSCKHSGHRQDEYFVLSNRRFSAGMVSLLHQHFPDGLHVNDRPHFGQIALSELASVFFMRLC